MHRNSSRNLTPFPLSPDKGLSAEPPAVEGPSFHHFGLAIRAETEAISFLRSLGYTIGNRVEDPLQDVALRFCTHAAMPSVEIITPRKSESNGPLATYLKSGTALVYHIGFATGRIEDTLAQWERCGHRVVTVMGPQPAVLFGGRRVAFYSLRGFGLVELVEGVD